MDYMNRANLSRYKAFKFLSGAFVLVTRRYSPTGGCKRDLTGVRNNERQTVFLQSQNLVNQF